MNLDIFEKMQSETREHTPYGGSLAHDDVASLKHKIEKRKNKQRKVFVVVGGLALLVLVLALFSGYSWYKLQLLAKQEVTGAPSQSGAAEGFVPSTPKTGEEIIRALGEHILLPSGNPQIAEVQDVAKLKATQAFFRDAENGDIVVVYETMIFIYRPSADIVVAASDISGVGQTKP